VLDGNPVDEQHVVASLERHKQTFGDVPELYGSDRGFFSEKNVMSCKQEGVKVVCIPQRGRHQGAPNAKPMRRAGSSRTVKPFAPALRGAISVLFRGRGMKRCLAQGRERFELWVAAAVLANNLMTDCSPVGGPIITQTKSRLTISSQVTSFVAARYPARTILQPTRRPYGAFGETATKIGIQMPG